MAQTGGRRERQRAERDGVPRLLDAAEHGVDVDAPMRRPVGAQATSRLLELALAARTISPPGVQPGDGDVHEPLQEVALGRGRVAPLVLQLLVRLEILAGPNQR